MQPVADLHLLQLAEIGIELAERPVRCLADGDAAILVESGGADEFDDLRRERLEAARIAARGREIFVDQALELGDAAIALGARQRRRQMIDDDGLGAPLRLGALAGVVDDERVEMRQRAERRLGKALRRERHRLAGQPFEIAVLAHLHDGVGAKVIGEPGVKGEIAVRRHEIGRVVARSRVDVVAARRLQTDCHLAETECGDGEIAAIEAALAEERITLRRAPACVHRILHGARLAGEEGGIVGARQALLHRPVGIPVRRPGEQAGDQRVAVRRQIADVVALRRHRSQHLDGSRRRVEADAVADAAVAIGIVGEDDGDAALASPLAAQAQPVAREIGDEGDAVGDRPVGDEIGLGERIARRTVLEGEGTGDDASVDLGQRDVHDDVARIETAGAGVPRLRTAAGKDDLQDRAVEGVERRGAARCARRRHREAGAVEDDVGRRRRKNLAEDGECLRVLEALHEERQRVDAARVERGGQRVDRRRVGRLHQRPVEDDRGDRRVGTPRGANRGKVGHRLPRPIETGAQQRRRFTPRRRAAADQIGGVAQAMLGIAGAAFGEIAPQALRRLVRHGARRRELRIRPLIARQQGERDAALAAQRRQPIDAIAPIAASAEDPRDDQASMGNHPLDIEIDRIVVAKPHEVGETQAGPIRQRLDQTTLRCRQAGDLAVGRREDDDLRRALGEVDCGAAVGDRPGLGGKEVHRRL